MLEKMRSSLSVLYVGGYATRIRVEMNHCKGSTWNFNIDFIESRSFFDYFVMHDIDLLPLDQRELSYWGWGRENDNFYFSLRCFFLFVSCL